jgi:hypothetical protein
LHLPFHGARIAGLRTEFLEIAAASEPLCTFVRFRDPAVYPKFAAKVINEIFDNS